MPSDQRSAGRPRADQQTVTPIAIGRAACEILRTEGAAALTMSRVAQQLEVRSQSLYHHVRNLSEVVDAARAVTLAAVDLAPLDIDQPFEAGVETFARSYFDAFVPLSKASWVFFQHPIHDPISIEMYERFMRRAVAEGLSPARSLTLMLDIEYAVFFVVYEHESLKSVLPAEALARHGATTLHDALQAMASETLEGSHTRLITRVRELLRNAHA